ncbi:hypothetical protein [Streptomyces acidicola]|uniref:Uncharacterized protein n=1 Tax=Streptomyces acidicola TaxID=2596892 RepID=A0A5N8WJF4_9ACTN|nr:hypothetical protein [Streptomyces acidicola]MPY47103.1 hypothetical protein [Streptomyces acidicola]MPY47242.1 hypothetical protein [Streptomyces acidicola]
MDESQTWQIDVDGPIIVGPADTDRLEHLYDGLYDDSTYGAPEPPMPEARTVACPQCGRQRNLIATGRWTDPARMKCPDDGQEWTEDATDQHTGLTLMQALIQGSTAGTSSRPSHPHSEKPS